MRSIFLGLGILLLDQWTKLFVRTHFCLGESRPVIEGFFNLVYVKNDGAAWNALSGQRFLLVGISVAALVLLAVFHRHFLRGGMLHRILFGLLLGGIAGNMIDRLVFGWVTDFLDFQFGSYHYPSFNVADSAICIAMVLYIASDLFSKKKEEPAA